MIQEKLCEKHRTILDIIWTWGWGCALQPQLVELGAWFGLYASAQMCRRGIRELKQAGLIKASTWVDGRSEILVLCKPAIAFVTGKASAQVSSYPKHATRDTELLSVCRMMYLQDLAKDENIDDYNVLMNIVSNGINSVPLRIGELLHYWRSHNLYKQFLYYRKQLVELEQSAATRQNLHNHGTKIVTEKLPYKLINIEALHRRQIAVTGLENDNGATQFQFCIFNTHNFTTKRIIDDYVLCNDWVRLLNDSNTAYLTVYCLDELQAQNLEKQLLKQTDGRAYWKHVLEKRADTQSDIPIRIQNIGLKTKYMNSG